MTIVCGIHENGQTWIGSDSLVTTGSGHKFTTDFPKWVVSFDGSYAIGCTGEVSTHNLVRNNSEEIFASAPSVDEICERMRHHFLRKDYATSSSESGPRRYTSPFLIATPCGIYDVDGGFGYLRINDGELGACGSGCDYAIGAAHALQDPTSRHHEPYPSVRVTEAILAAIKYDSGCGGAPWVFALSSPGGVRGEIRSSDCLSNSCGEKSLGALRSGIAHQGCAGPGAENLAGQSGLAGGSSEHGLPVRHDGARKGDGGGF